MLWCPKLTGVIVRLLFKIEIYSQRRILYDSQKQGCDVLTLPDMSCLPDSVCKSMLWIKHYCTCMSQQNYISVPYLSAEMWQTPSLCLCPQIRQNKCKYLLSYINSFHHMPTDNKIWRVHTGKKKEFKWLSNMSFIMYWVWLRWCFILRSKNKAIQALQVWLT